MTLTIAITNTKNIAGTQLFEIGQPIVSHRSSFLFTVTPSTNFLPTPSVRRAASHPLTTHHLFAPLPPPRVNLVIF